MVNLYRWMPLPYVDHGVPMDLVLLDVFSRAVEEYNRYRSPEAIARIEFVEGRRIYVSFTGSYCETCGLYDWIEDLLYVLERYGITAVIEHVEEVSWDTMIAVFRIESKSLTLAS